MLRRAVFDATRIVDGIRSDQLDGATPCEAFTVQQLVTHLAEGAEMMAVSLDGGGPSTDQSWKSVSQRLVDAGEGPGAPDGIITLPYGDFPRSVVIEQAFGEIAIHAADLARSTSQAIGDAEVYENAMAVVGDEWRVEGVLGPALPCPADAPVADRLLAFAGRKI